VCCGRVYEPSPWEFFCRECGCLLEPFFASPPEVEWGSALRGRGVWRYRAFLPLREGIEPVTLGEGATPLVRLVSQPGRVWLKFEGANPTGSFKDRGMTVGVTLARHIGVKGIAVASTGNTASSAAAYARRAGMACRVYLPRGKVAEGKLAQARLHGAEIVEVEGAFDAALEELLAKLKLGGLEGFYPLNSFNFWRLEGQKTIAFEVVEELGAPPDYVFVPVGNAGNISAIWKGFRELRSAGLVDRLPKMIGVQAEGASPLVKTWESKSKELIPVEEPKTIASAIRIGKPVNWVKALRAVEESGGAFVSVTDEEIIKAVKSLARSEGVGVEPASAAALAGYWRLLERGVVDREDVAVLVATGHALKDISTILASLGH